MNGSTPRRNRVHKVRTLKFIPALGMVFILSVCTASLPVETRAADAVQVAVAVEEPYVINAASFLSKKSAEATQDRLARSGFRTYISKGLVKGVTWYRVRVGFYKSASLAREELKKVVSADKSAKSAWVSRAPLSELAPRTADIKESASREVIRAPKKREVTPPAAKKAAKPLEDKKAIPASAKKVKSPKPIASTKGYPLKTDAAPRRPYVINVTSLESKREAQKLSKRLISSGYKSYISTANIKGKTWYRVRIGFFDNYEAAKKEVKNVSLAYDAADGAWVSRAPLSEFLKIRSAVVKKSASKVVTSAPSRMAVVKPSTLPTLQKKVVGTAKKAGVTPRVTYKAVKQVESKKEIPAVAKNEKVRKPQTVKSEGSVKAISATIKPYVINLASFKSKRDAETLRESLVSGGHIAYISMANVKGNTWYRVRVGFFDSYKTAKGKIVNIAKVYKDAESAWISKAPLSEVKLVSEMSKPIGSGGGEAVAALNNAAPKESLGTAFVGKLKGAATVVGSATGSALDKIKSIPEKIRGGDKDEALMGADVALKKETLEEDDLPSKAEVKTSVSREAAVAATAVGAAGAVAVTGVSEGASGAASTTAGASLGTSILSKLKGVGSAVGSAAGATVSGIKNLPGIVTGSKEKAASSVGVAEAPTKMAALSSGEESTKAVAAQGSEKVGIFSRIGKTVKRPFSFLKSSPEEETATPTRVVVKRSASRNEESAPSEDGETAEASGGFKTTMTNIGLALPHSIAGVGPISNMAEIHGSLSVNENYSSESNSTYSRNFLSTRLNLDAIKLDNAGTMSLHFSGSNRTILSGNKYSSSVKTWRVNRFYMEYEPVKDRLFFRVGRLTPKEGVGESVDGVNVLVKRKTYGVGFFAGTKPDPYTGGFDSSFTSSGAYAFYRKDQLFSNIAFVNNTFNGSVDRQYLSGTISFVPMKKFRVFGSAMGDVNQDSGGMDFTNGYVEVSYRPDFKKSVAVGMRQFRSIRFYESMDFVINTSQQTSYYIRGNYRLLKKYALFGKYERRTADTGVASSGLRETDTYMLGVSHGNILGFGVSGNLNVSYSKNSIPSSTYSKGYNSSYTVYNFRFSKELIEKVNLSVNGSVMKNKYGLTEETDTTLRYGASLNLRPSRSWNISLSYDGTKRDDYTTTNINSRVSYRF